MEVLWSMAFLTGLTSLTNVGGACVVAKGLGSAVLPVLQPHSYLLLVWPWKRDLMPRSLSFSICKMWMVLVPGSLTYYKDYYKGENAWKALGMTAGIYWGLNVSGIILTSSSWQTPSVRETEHGTFVVQSKKMMAAQCHLPGLADCPWPRASTLCVYSNRRETHVHLSVLPPDLGLRSEGVVSAILRECHHRSSVEVNAKWIWICRTNHIASNAFCPCRTCSSLCPPEFPGA